MTPLMMESLKKHGFSNSVLEDPFGGLVVCDLLEELGFDVEGLRDHSGLLLDFSGFSDAYGNEDAYGNGDGNGYGHGYGAVTRNRGARRRSREEGV